jgi:hypothetical protein
MKKEKKEQYKRCTRLKQNEGSNENHLSQVEAYSMDQLIYKNDRWLPTIVQVQMWVYFGFSTELRIHDNLVRIRIRIRGSMPLTDGFGFGSGSLSFHHWPSRCQQKKITFLRKFVCILLFESTSSFFKYKKSKRSHKTVEIKVFLTIFA